MSKNLKNKIAEGGAAILVGIAILAVCYGLSWIVTCGVIMQLHMVIQTKKYIMIGLNSVRFFMVWIYQMI